MKKISKKKDAYISHKNHAKFLALLFKLKKLISPTKEKTKKYPNYDESLPEGYRERGFLGTP